MRSTALLLAAVSCLAVGAASAQAPAGGVSAAATVAPSEAGYLKEGQLPDAVALIGPPPPVGSGTLAGDVATYEATRKLEGTPRWAMATMDAEFGPKFLLQSFACALGMKLDRATAPALYRLLTRLEASTEAIQRKTKIAFQRPRPFIDHPGATCTPQEAWMKQSYSYPSGHAHYGWAGALVLAEIAPDRATEIMARGRTYGESRVVCGVHYTSDIQASRVVASALFAALQSDPGFQADLAEAKREVAGRRPEGALAPDAGQCRVEAEAAAKPAW